MAPAYSICENRMCIVRFLLCRYRRTFHLLTRPFEFVYSGYSQSRSAFPLWSLKNPPSIATGGLLKPLCVYYTYTVDPSETPKRYSRHSLMLLINICLLTSFIYFNVLCVSTLCISFTLVFILCQQLYLSFLKKVSLFSGFLILENSDTVICLLLSVAGIHWTQ